MSPISSITRLAKTDAKWYLFLGVLSLLKAVGVRHDRRRLRRELLDAALFLGLGLLLRAAQGRGSSSGSTSDSSVRSKVRSKTDGRSSSSSKSGGKLASAKASLRDRFSDDPDTTVESLLERFSESRSGSSRSKRDALRNRLSRS